MKWLFALLALFVLTGARDPILVPDISQHEVEVRQGFTGTELLLYGAILTPEGQRANGDYDVVVLLEGPTRPIVLREKRRVAGMWVNADSQTLRSAPSYYAVASSRPIDPAVQARFASGLSELMHKTGLYSQNENAVTMTGGVLYRARIYLPSRVQTGTYTAETFAISHGRVVASATSRVEVRKIGMEKAIADFSRRHGFYYGLLTVALSVGMGWMAGRLFALV